MVSWPTVLSYSILELYRSEVTLWIELTYLVVIVD